VRAHAPELRGAVKSRLLLDLLTLVALAIAFAPWIIAAAVLHQFDLR
jgi:hypothetical protein